MAGSYAFGVNGRIEGDINFLVGLEDDPYFNVTEVIETSKRLVSEWCKDFFLSPSDSPQPLANSTIRLLTCYNPNLVITPGWQHETINDTWTLALSDTPSNCSAAFTEGLENLFAWTCKNAQKHESMASLGIALAVLLGGFALCYVISMCRSRCSETSEAPRRATVFQADRRETLPLVNKDRVIPYGYYGSGCPGYPMS